MRIVNYNPAIHRNFVLSGYLKAQRKHPKAKYATDRQFYDFSEPYFDAVLRNSTTLVVISPEDSNIFIGFIVFRGAKGVQKGCIDYVYVKYAMRKFGVAKALLNKAEELHGPSFRQMSVKPQHQWQRALTHKYEYNPYSPLAAAFQGKYGEDNWEFEHEQESTTTVRTTEGECVRTSEAGQ